MNGAIAAVVAHPDDEALIAGGTLALAARGGLHTTVVSLTRGELGSISGSAPTTRLRLGNVREAELATAGRILGVDRARCLGYPDGELRWVDHAAAARELATLLTARVPDVVLTFGDDGLYGHPDHTAAGQVVARAVRRLRPPVQVYEAVWPTSMIPGLAAAAAERGLPRDLWGIEPEAFGTDRAPDLTIDVTPVLAQKLAAVRAHRSQFGPDHLLTALPLDLAERFLANEYWVGPRPGKLEELLGLD